MPPYTIFELEVLKKHVNCFYSTDNKEEQTIQEKLFRVGCLKYLAGAYTISLYGKVVLVRCYGHSKSLLEPV